MNNDELKQCTKLFALRVIRMTKTLPREVNAARVRNADCGVRINP